MSHSRPGQRGQRWPSHQQRGGTLTGNPRQREPVRREQYPPSPSASLAVGCANDKTYLWRVG